MKRSRMSDQNGYLRRDEHNLEYYEGYLSNPSELAYFEIH